MDRIQIERPDFGGGHLAAGTHERFTPAWCVRSGSRGSEGHKSFPSCEDEGT